MCVNKQSRGTKVGGVELSPLYFLKELASHLGDRLPVYTSYEGFPSARTAVFPETTRNTLLKLDYMMWWQDQRK